MIQTCLFTALLITNIFSTVAILYFVLSFHEHIFAEFQRQLMRAVQTALMRLEQQGRQLDAIQRHLCSSTEQPREKDDVLQSAFEDLDAFENFEKSVAGDASIKLRLVCYFIVF